MRASIYCSHLLLFVGVLVPALCWNTLANSAGDNSPVLPKYEVAGFREVRFGMTEPEVRAAATKAFGLKALDLTGATNPVEGTSVHCEQEVEGGRDVYVVPLPAVVTVKEGLNLPRYPSVPGRMRAGREPTTAGICPACLCRVTTTAQRKRERHVERTGRWT